MSSWAMSYILKPFQETAVQHLTDKFFKSSKKEIVFSAPTGSGKTIMIIDFLIRVVENNPYLENFAFIWLTPGNGELEEQSHDSMRRNTQTLNAQFLNDALTAGFKKNSATFINWEQVTKKGNIATREGEVANIYEQINTAHQNGLHIVVIIDEEHRNQTAKSQELIDKIQPSKIIRVSATPQSRGSSFEYVQVDEESAIAEHMITRLVVLNEGIKDAEIMSDTTERFLDLADDKRRSIKSAYAALGKNINPLVLIQFPDEKTGKSQATANYMNERSELISQCESYLKNSLGQNENTIARWLSGDHLNIDGIEQNESSINYLIMKQAVATGWDAPRAKILVKLRLNTETNFTLQTIGRIRRMPEQIHYNNPILDDAFVYSNDEKYINDVLEQGASSRISQFFLKKNAPDFNLVSLKPTSAFGMTVSEITVAFWEFFNNKYKLSKDKNRFDEINRLKLNSAGYDFDTTIKVKLSHSNDFTQDVLQQQLKAYRVSLPVDTRKHRLMLLDRIQDIQKSLYLDTYKEAHALLIELFSERGEGLFVPPLMKLNNREWWSFVINNHDLLRNEAREMDADNLFGFSNDQVEPVKFELPPVESYKVALGVNSKPKVFNKNIYEGYSELNFVARSEPERMLELWLEKCTKIKWWYKSRDRGTQYFSIAYGNKREGFFPDYLVQDVEGLVYIIETKGGQNQNIDNYSEAKFDALKDYIHKDWSVKKEFAFVRPDGIRLVFNNTYWDDDLSNRNVWKPLDELFDF